MVTPEGSIKIMAAYSSDVQALFDGYAIHFTTQKGRAPRAEVSGVAGLGRFPQKATKPQVMRVTATHTA